MKEIVSSLRASRSAPPNDVDTIAGDVLRGWETLDSPPSTMRYIGNKSKLVPFITQFLRRRGIRGGRALDAFAGTGTVSSALKAEGFSVVACDIMTYSYVFQRAYIVPTTTPRFAGIANDPDIVAARGQAQNGARSLEDILAYFTHDLTPRPSFLTQHFSAPEEAAEQGLAEGQRMYFTQDTAARVDAIREDLELWRLTGALTEDEYYILLAALIEGTDLAANTTGTYAAFLKRWHANTRRPFKLYPSPLANWSAPAGMANLGDINALAPTLGHFDLLYLDPPYNNRQYVGYYHVPEVIARGWFDGGFIMRGKTGLLDSKSQISVWSNRALCVGALEDLITQVDAEHVVMSYNNEGIIPDEEIERIFRQQGVEGTYHRTARRHFRYRSDNPSPQRRYTANRVTEYLYYVRLPTKPVSVVVPKTLDGLHLG